MNSVPRAMTIAGSDSGGGAGIQADLKTFAAFGVYGTSAVTAITAQNTQKVTDVLELSPELVAAQIDAVLQDIGADAVKTGMLSNSAIIKVVAGKVREYEVRKLVVDPVMVSKGGDRLLKKEAIDALREDLLPLALVATPNVAEAEVITGVTVKTLEDAQKAAERIVGMGAKNALVKGGHLDGPPIDTFYDGREFREFKSIRIETRNTHGTGCTLASAIAAGLARGLALEEAIARAKRYVTEAIRWGFHVGQGHGPLDHFYKLTSSGPWR
jgi:hydroxymethylpyrimidine/phosphomethylpyrimidine kinase